MCEKRVQEVLWCLSRNTSSCDLHDVPSVFKTLVMNDKIHSSGTMDGSLPYRWEEG